MFDVDGKHSPKKRSDWRMGWEGAGSEETDGFERRKGPHYGGDAYYLYTCAFPLRRADLCGDPSSGMESQDLRRRPCWSLTKKSRNALIFVRCKRIFGTAPCLPGIAVVPDIFGWMVSGHCGETPRCCAGGGCSACSEPPNTGRLSDVVPRRPIASGSGGGYS